MGFLKKIFKPVSKVLDKIVPNEIKPALPYLSAFAPMLMPTTGIFSSMLGRGLTSGGLNLVSQLAQEGNEGDVNMLSALMSGGIGALSAPGASDTIQKLRGADHASEFATAAGDVGTSGWIDKGLRGLEKGADYLSAAEGSGGLADILRKGGVAPGLNMETAAALGIPLTQGAMDTAYNQAKLLERDWERDQESDDGDGEPDRGRAVRMAMEQAGHDEQTIVEMLASLGYEDPGPLGLKEGGRVGFDKGGAYMDVPYSLFVKAERAVENEEINPRTGDPYDNVDQYIEAYLKGYKEEDFKYKTGGRVGFAFGGIDSAVEQVDDVEMKENIKFAQNMDIPMETVVEKFIIKFKRKPNNLDELKRFYKTISQSDMNIKETITERMTAKDGGMMSVLPRGKEMDYRGGGMIPMGSKERADDVPARLSKNEFVMTADAVRAAGGGSVNEGARRMYNLMNNLEARA